MDPITQLELATLRIEELLRERQHRHEAGAPWYGGTTLAGAARQQGPPLHRRVRRRLGALLILAGRQIGGGGGTRSAPAYGSTQQ